jgi:sterol desaturase/sphingolipid hydroxylase (fatty acid hydroxylase superfamily)
MKQIAEVRLNLRRELEEPAALRRFGSGWISGVLGLVFALGGFFLVLSLRAPGTFSMPEVQAIASTAWFRVALHVLLLSAFGLSALSLALRRGKVLGSCGVIVTLLAALLGGSRATALTPDPTPLFFGLDWFVLNVLFTGFLFVPLERLFPQRSEQGIFREEWREDLFYYLVSSLMVQALTVLAFTPARSILLVAPLTTVRAWVGQLPFVIQFVAIMFLTDFVQYWVHRAFHRVPWLWKFHSVHHSARSMDWMAGARMHFLEIIALRGTTVIPMIVLGFSEVAVQSYILLVYLYSTFVHANVGWRLPWLERLLVTPRYHHWHHGIEREAIDVNFAIHFPLFDRLFGTHYLPGEKWPSGYGIGGHPVPLGYRAQFMHPFRRKARAVAAAAPVQPESARTEAAAPPARREGSAGN